MTINACIFDLDGVLVDTAKYHYVAWKRLANELGFDITEHDNEKLKGVSRMGSLELILKWGGIELDEARKEQLAARKNEWYVEKLLEMDPDEILPGVISFLDEVKAKGIKIGLGSASKNAMTIVKKLNLEHYFGAIVDGTKVVKGKPDPEVFLTGVKLLGVEPAHCIVFEDAPKGITAALNGGMYAVGVGKADALSHAHCVIPGFANLQFNDLLDTLQHIELAKI